MIKIKLPVPSDYSGNIKGFLKQMELSIHHAQKSYEQLVEEGYFTNDGIQQNDIQYASFRFPGVDLYEREQDDEGYVKVHVDEEGEQMQEIEIELSKM